MHVCMYVHMYDYVCMYVHMYDYVCMCVLLVEMLLSIDVVLSLSPFLPLAPWKQVQEHLPVTYSLSPPTSTAISPDRRGRFLRRLAL